MSGALFALFASALGYGTLVPLVPVYLGASGGGDVVWHTGAALHLRGPLGFGSAEVAGLFIACGATMALVQLVLLPRVPASASRVAWALALVAASGAALAAMPFARSYAATLALANPLGGALGLAFGLLGLQMASAGGAGIILLALALAALMQIDRRVLRRGNR